MMRALARDVAAFLLPDACVVCERPGPQLCGVCATRCVPVPAGCPRCQQPLPPVGPCRACADWTTLTTARSAVWLDDEARTTVHHLKYEGCYRLAEPLADLMVRRLALPAGVLVPIPLGARRLRDRGYNQAAVLAHALGDRWQLPVREDLLTRVRETRTQTALLPEARLANVAEAFSAASALPPSLPRGGEGGRAVILCDDVLTTGATLRAAADALAAAGWGPVQAVSFARARPWVARIIA